MACLFGLLFVVVAPSPLFGTAYKPSVIIIVRWLLSSFMSVRDDLRFENDIQKIVAIIAKSVGELQLVD